MLLFVHYSLKSLPAIQYPDIHDSSIYISTISIVITKTKHMNLRLMYQRSLFVAKKFMPTAFFSTNLQRLSVSMVQGASRGIGLEFVKQLLERDQKGHVLATCRNPDQSSGLHELKSKFAERLNIMKLDVTAEKTIEAAAKSVGDIYGYLNLLVNASGILSIPDLLHPETTLTKVQKSAMMLAYEVNAVGPILVIKHMWPFLKAGGGLGTQREAAVVASLSARVGSITDNHLGGWHSYRASKAALNQLTRTVSVELARKKDPIVCLLLHPGTVNTDLSRPFQRNVPEGKLFTTEYSVNKLLSIIDGAKIHDNGKFFAWDGQEIPW